VLKTSHYLLLENQLQVSGFVLTKIEREKELKQSFILNKKKTEKHQIQFFNFLSGSLENAKNKKSSSQ
jgi:hypothetical protein